MLQVSSFNLLSMTAPSGTGGPATPRESMCRDGGPCAGMEAPGLTSLREVESLTGWLLWSLQLDDELLRAKESGNPEATSCLQRQGAAEPGH